MEEKPATPGFVPYDVENEQALLGLVFVHKDFIPLIRADAPAEDFYDELHQQLFELIYEFDDEQKAVTPLTLRAWAKHFPDFDKVGGLEYLTSCAQASPALSPGREGDRRTVAGMARHVAEMRLRREAEGAVLDAQEKLRRGDPTADSLIEVAKLSDDMQGRFQVARGAILAGNAGLELATQIEKQAVSERAFACPSGLADLDHILGGLLPGDLIIVAGRPGMGKSVVGTHFCKNAAMAGWAADYWSLEMPARQLAARFIADLDYDKAIQENRRPLRYSDLVKLRADQAQLSHATQAAIDLQELDIQIFDAERVTIERIAGVSRARAATSKKKKLFVVDHLGLVEPDARYQGRKVDEIGQVTKRAKQIAKQTESPVVLLCQLNRRLDDRADKRPMLSDLRDSGNIEQDADTVLMLYRGAYYAEIEQRQAKTEEQRVRAMAMAEGERDVLEILVEKNRAGEAGGKPIRVFIDIKCSAIRDVRPMPGGAPGFDFSNVTPLRAKETS